MDYYSGAEGNRPAHRGAKPTHGRFEFANAPHCLGFITA
jgi:hypothetical protein